MMAWLQPSSLRRNRSVRPCLLLYLHRAHTMLLLKMPVEETKTSVSSSLTLDVPLFRRHPRTVCCFSSCLFCLVHLRVLKISHASVCVPGARVAFSLSVRQILKSAVLNWNMTLARCHSFAHASIVFLDITSIIWNCRLSVHEHRTRRLCPPLDYD